jgi:hypothetical protein
MRWWEDIEKGEPEASYTVNARLGQAKEIRLLQRGAIFGAVLVVSGNEENMLGRPAALLTVSPARIKLILPPR